MAKTMTREQYSDGLDAICDVFEALGDGLCPPAMLPEMHKRVAAFKASVVVTETAPPRAAARLAVKPAVPGRRSGAAVVREARTAGHPAPARHASQPPAPPAKPLHEMSSEEFAAAMVTPITESASSPFWRAGAAAAPGVVTESALAADLAKLSDAALESVLAQVTSHTGLGAPSWAA